MIVEYTRYTVPPAEADRLVEACGSPQFRPFFQAIEPFLKSIEEMRHHDPTGVFWSR